MESWLGTSGELDERKESCMRGGGQLDERMVYPKSEPGVEPRWQHYILGAPVTQEDSTDY